MMVDNFENSFGHFYKIPTYSGSTEGISVESYTDTSSALAYVDDRSLQIVLKDNTSSSDDWKVRLLSGAGAPTNNVKLSKDRELRFAIKTAQNGAEISVLIDDAYSELESSDRISIIGDNLWHTYSVQLDSADLWNSYLNGNGVIDAAYVTLDALMFYAPEQSADRIFYLDALEIAEIDAPLTSAIEAVPNNFRFHPNYPLELYIYSKWHVYCCHADKWKNCRFTKASFGKINFHYQSLPICHPELDSGSHILVTPFYYGAIQ